MKFNVDRPNLYISIIFLKNKLYLLNHKCFFISHHQSKLIYGVDNIK